MLLNDALLLSHIIKGGLNTMNLSQAGFISKVGGWKLIGKGPIGFNRLLVLTHATIYIALLNITKE